MAVFGAPMAHEDDPERAVRAALAIRDALAEDGELEVRIGITTGEALIALDARPDAGEGMASGRRRQHRGASPGRRRRPGAILVDETTLPRHRATRSSYGTLDPVDGEGQGTRRWRRGRPYAARVPVGAERAGGAARSSAARGSCRRSCDEAMQGADRARARALITLVGVPGIGKISPRPRALRHSVGDVVGHRAVATRPLAPRTARASSFWAFGEIVKAQAGILETDVAAQARRRSSPARSPQRRSRQRPRRTGSQRHLLRCSGVESGRWAATTAARRALRRVAALPRGAWPTPGRSSSSSRTSTGPTTACSTSSHSLADWLRGPRHSSCSRRHAPSSSSAVPAGAARCTGRRCSRSSRSQTTRHRQLDRRTAPISDARPRRRPADDAARAVGRKPALRRAVRAHGRRARRSSETVAARPSRRSSSHDSTRCRTRRSELSHDASVIGRRLLARAVAAAGGSDRWTRRGAPAGARAEGARRRRSPRVVRRGRDGVGLSATRSCETSAYAADPTSVTAPRSTAAWPSGSSRFGRADDHAELARTPLRRALSSSLAPRGSSSPRSRPERVARRCNEAGDRAVALHAFVAAARFYRPCARAPRPRKTLHGPRLLLELGRALWFSEGEGEDELLAARAVLELGDREGATEAEALLAEVSWVRGRRKRRAEMEVAAVSVRELASPAKARALLPMRARGAVASTSRDSPRGERSRSPKTSVSTSSRLRALGSLTSAELELTTDAGFADLEESLELAIARLPRGDPRLHEPLAPAPAPAATFTRSLAYFEEALRLADVSDMPTGGMPQGMLAQYRYRKGRWDEALGVPPTRTWRKSEVSHYHVWHALGTRGMIRLSRGDERGSKTPQKHRGCARRSIRACPPGARIYGRRSCW